MTGHKCCVCGNTKAKEPGLSFHRIPKEPSRRAVWLQVFMLTEEDMKPSTRVCSRHFPDGDASKVATSVEQTLCVPRKAGRGLLQVYLLE